MNMDRKVRVLLANRSDQQCSGVGFQDTSHILKSKDIDIESDQLVNKVDVILKIVLFLGVLLRQSVKSRPDVIQVINNSTYKHISRNANGTLGDTTGLLNGLDTDLKLIDVI